jgi:hypothetical protein
VPSAQPMIAAAQNLRMSDAPGIAMVEVAKCR